MIAMPLSSGGLLTNRNFVLLWQGQFVSQAGNQAFAIAMMYWLMQETGSATMMGLLMMASALPAIVLGPVGGVVADRHSRMHIIVFADALRGVVVLAFAVVLFAVPQATTLTVALLFAVVLVKGIAGAAFQPAVAAAIPDLVRPEKIAAANSMHQLSIQVAVMCGQAAGGLLYRLLGAPMLFALDGASYLLSAFSEAFIRIPEHDAPNDTSGSAALASYVTDMREGLRFVWRQSGMRSLLATAAAINFLVMPVIVLLPFFVSLTLQQGAEWYGFLLAAMGAGAVLGYAAISAVTIPASHRPLLVATCFAAISLSISMLAATREPVVALALFVALGVCTAVINLLVITLCQIASPPRLRGRIMSFVYTLSSAVSPLGMAMGGLLGDVTGMRTSAIYFACSVLMFIVIALSASRQSFRRFLAIDVLR